MMKTRNKGERRVVLNIGSHLTMSVKLTPDARAGIVYRRAQDMLIGARLRALRKQKNLSQDEIGKRIGLLRFYVSRVENNHTVPSIDTLEKIARALDVPIYVLFYNGEEPPKGIAKMDSDKGWGNSGEDAVTLRKFRRLLSRMNPTDRRLLVAMAMRMTRGRHQHTSVGQ